MAATMCIKCPECKKTLSSTSLNYHLFKFHDKKATIIMCPYPNCGLKVKQAALRSHVEVMHEDKFKCQKCQKVYQSKARLTAHINNDHAQLQVPRAFCDACGSSFKTKELMNLHKNRIHGSSLSYCTICDKKFSTVSQLKSHNSKIHQGKIKCTKCDKIYSSKTALQLHTKKKHVITLNLDEIDPLLTPIIVIV
jgi:uncharacterized C2H2 Zn-finger protein